MKFYALRTDNPVKVISIPIQMLCTKLMKLVLTVYFTLRLIFMYIYVSLTLLTAYYYNAAHPCKCMFLPVLVKSTNVQNTRHSSRGSMLQILSTKA